ncbi:hypothetical protein C1646_54970 [Rhizophagus diaphanus]|nr:hypothetical protein C1646_54970 [Rhizophagus diaphanus] [Rhizophagus sp. MUCL 43196]
MYDSFHYIKQEISHNVLIYCPSKRCMYVLPIEINRFIILLKINLRSFTYFYSFCEIH